MRYRTIAAHRANILRHVSVGDAHVARITLFNGRRERAAAERLRDQGMVRIVELDRRHGSDWLYACIPPGDEWDFKNACILRPKTDLPVDPVN